jgi:ATP-dependent helicase/nuclease subunit A
MATTLSPDQQQREQALVPDQSFIIQAPAGSGKTELLIQRLLVLLARVNHPEEILAITFTRKAAAEMKHRILQALERAASEPEPDKNPGRQTWHLAQAVLQRDKLKNWQLLTNPHRLRLQTIDSLCASLTRQMPVLSEFGAQPQVAEDSLLYYRAAVHSFMATLDSTEPWVESLAYLLMHLDNRHKHLEELLIAMLAKRDQWMPHLTGLAKIADLRQLLEAEFSHIAAEKLSSLQRLLPLSLVQELMQLIQYAQEQLPTQQANFMPLDGVPEFTADFLSIWCTLASFLLTKDFNWRKRVDARDGFPAAGQSSGQEAERRKLMKAKFTQLLEQLSTQEDLKQTLQDVLELPPCHFSETQWQAIAALLEILPIASGFLWLTFQEHNVVDYIEVTQRALHALGESHEPSQLALSLDYQIQHILVDEFQDTSVIQYRLLSKLTAGWQQDDGRTLFIVGDPMQSIYRFRKAEVGLFLQTETQGINDVKLHKLTLSSNFRSQSGLVLWFNQVFKQIFPTQVDMSKGAVPYSQALGVLPLTHSPAMQIHGFCDDNEAEVQEIIALIQQYLQRDSSTSVAVLVRARSHLIDLLPALQRANIAYRAVEIESLRHKTAIQDLLALTRALLFLDDRIAWLALLRSPWCGLSHADLYAIAGHGLQLPIWQRLQQCEQLEISEDGQKRLQFLLTTLSPYLANRSRRTLACWLESIWLQLGGPASLVHISEQADVQTFFKLLALLQNGEDIVDIAQLERRLHELYAAPNSAPDLRLELMTIHKAKGLEFDVVILPKLHKEGTADDSELLLFAERPLATTGIGLVLAPIKAFHEKQDPIYRFLQQTEKNRAAHELNRLLYVAVTRAKQKLHLFGQVTMDKQQGIKSPGKDSLLGRLWPILEAELNMQLSAKNSVAIESLKSVRQITHARRLVTGWQPPFSVASSQVETTVQNSQRFINHGETLRHVGTLLHRLLYSLSKLDYQHWSTMLQQQQSWRMALLQLGVIPTEIEAALKTIEQALTRTMADERGQWLLANTHKAAQSEYALSYFDGHVTQQFILDRTFIDEAGRRWIIDYKTTVQQPTDLIWAQTKYAKQLETYAHVMRQQSATEEIWLGLYFPLVSMWFEWPDMLN